MSISSYAELQTAVASWLRPGGSSSVLTAIIPDLIMLGEKRIHRDVRSHEMETAFSSAISSGVVAAPDGFLAWKTVYIDGSPVSPMKVKPLPWIFEKYPTRSAEGRPKFIARNAGNFEFGPYPDSNYTVKGTYYKRLTTVSSSWNALATNNPDLYLLAALCEAAPYLREDPRLVVWESKYKTIKDAINSEAEAADFSGSALSMTAG